MKICILGAGAYGLALASMFHLNNCEITLWTKLEEEKNLLEKNRENKIKLPAYIIPEDIIVTTNMEEAIKNKDIIVMCVPTAFVDSTSIELKKYITNDQHICIATKGIENDTCLFVNQIIEKHIKTNKIAIISGGSFAVDIIKMVPIGLSLATKCDETADVIQKALQNNFLKLRRTDDIIGTEICSAIKNVVAIGAGILAGMNMPESSKAMFITESLHDIKDLIDDLGGDKNTILSFAGFGDILLTCTSEKSRNFTFGKLIGENKNKDEIDNYIKNTTIEGLYTLNSIYKLAKEKNISVPLINIIYDIVYNDTSPKEIIKFLNTKD